jgi:hypothetical protein
MDLGIMVIEEQQGGQGLGLGRGRDLPLGSQVGEEGSHLGLAKIAAMAGTVVADEADDPPTIDLLGARAKSLGARLILDRLQE